MKDDEDSDVDLDFLPDEANEESESPTDPANAHLAVGHGGGALAPTRPTSLPLSSFNILQRIDQTATPSDSENAPQLAVGLPIHNSAFSRAFVKTIGRLGRLKRVLHSRSSARNTLAPCTDVSSFDLDATVSRDLLASRGGVERFLKGVEAPSSRQVPPLPVPLSPTTPPKTSPTTNPTAALQSISSQTLALPPQPVTPTTPTPSSFSVTQQSPTRPTSEARAAASVSSPSPEPQHEPETVNWDTYSFSNSDEDLKAHPEPAAIPPHRRAGSIISYASSTGSLGEVLDGRGSVKPIFARPVAERFDIISLDDFDMSDTASELHVAGPSVPPGLGGLKKGRKLPQKKEFEFLPRRSDISSMGIVSRSSIASSVASDRSGQAPSIGEVLDENAPVGLGGGVIQQWQMNALLDSLSVDEEDGDVDAALKRLEGQINPQKVKEKQSKVDGWVKQIQARLASGDYEDEEPRYGVDSDEEDISEAGDDDDFKHESVSQHNVNIYPPPPGLESSNSAEDSESGASAHAPLTPIPPSQAYNPASISASSSDTGRGDAKPVPEDVVPPEILKSRVSTILPPVPGWDTMQTRFPLPDQLRAHQSFILSYRALTLAEQFAMIDRELFMGVKFEELVTEEQWMNTEEVNVYDWAQYLKDRITWKAEKKFPEKTTALAALRARFNLMANFVISEIVLTQPSQRPLVVAKFIRIAWVRSSSLLAWKQVLIQPTIEILPAEQFSYLGCDYRCSAE